MTTKLPLTLLVLGLFTGACASSERVVIDDGKGQPASGTSATEPTTSATTFCTALCDRQEECDTSLDVQTCKNTCTNGFAAVFPKLRQDVVGVVVDCFASKDCKTVLGGSVVGTCAEEAVASVAPSAQAASFCDALGAAEKKCGKTTSKATCLDRAKLYSDATIAEAANCASRPCTEIDRCVDATFGSFGTTTGSSSSGTSSTSKCDGRFADLGSCTSCAEGSCCTEAAACANDGTCRAAMAMCQDAGSSSYSQCTSMLQSMPTTTRQLLGAYYQCASSKCSASCGFVQN